MKKQLKKLRSKKTKKRLRYLSRHPFVVPVTTFVVMFFMSMILFVMAGGQTIGATDSRVVQLFVDGNLQTIPTRAVTVEDLLTRLNISVTEEDIVEPSLTAEITDDNFQINVYRARPVLVEDEGKKVVALTAEPSPRAAVSEAGLTLYPEDIVEKAPLPEQLPSDVIKEGGIEERIIIDRATPVDINIFGSQFSIRTHSETIDDLLKERGLGDVSVLPSRNVSLSEGMSIFVTEPGKTLRVSEEPIEFDEEIRQDPSLASGSEKIEQQGELGRRAVVYEMNSDGSESVFNEVVVKPPVTQIKTVGTKPPTIIVSGDHALLMTQAGIPADQQAAAEYIISKESGWRLDARNASGCLGIGQACPGSKLVRACPNYANDPICQLQFFTSYVNNRPDYGSWNAAYQFWLINGWY